MASNVSVRARYNNGRYENAEALIRRFKKKCEKAGILQAMKDHEEYKSPSEKRRIKSKKARLRAAKDAKKRAKQFGD